MSTDCIVLQYPEEFAQLRDKLGKLKLSSIPGSEVRTNGTVEVIAEQRLPPSLELRYRGNGVA